MDQPDERLNPQRGEGLARRQFLRGIAASGAAVSASGLLVACSGSSGGSKAGTGVASSPAVQRRGGNLKVGLSGGSSSDTLDPHAGLTYLDTGRFEALYQPLVKLGKDAKNELVLAESITPNKNFTEWIIKVRPGITFHSGKALTAQDVVYTIRRVVDPANEFSGAPFFGPINAKGVKATDKNTVVVPMHTPFASLEDQLAGGWYYLYVVPDGFNGKKPDGTGPFVYQSFTPGQRSVFVRNKNYWKSGLPYVDTLTIIDFNDNSAVQDALVTGAIQAAGQLDPPQFPALANTSGVKTVASRTGQFKPFTMRVDKPPFNNPQIRQAMRLLVDRQQLIESALDGYGVVASDVFSPYDPDVNGSLHRQQDIPQAKKLLQQAGASDLTVTLTTSAIATATVAMATVLVEQAAAAGVKIRLQTVSAGTFFGNNYLSWDFSQDYYSYASYLSQVAQSFLDVSPFNETHSNMSGKTHYQNLYNQANATASPSVRKEIKYEMQKMDFEDGAYIIPTFMDSLDAYSTKITGYTTAKVGESLANWDFEHFSFV